ncbi:hypothetical protein IL306_005720 [Fusarium sp. DS 682]|nr:hypothetical protein IL306_005720 [Fusarium sp. DS 682]
MAAVMYAMFVASQIGADKLEKELAFTNLFHYDHFDLERPGFRMIRLERGQQSQLRCHLFQAYLVQDEMMDYEALSYVWGSQDTPHEIQVNEKTLAITKSLYEALQHLRQPNKDRILWVDALCIDQSNIKERGHQVNLMGEIYRKADRVIIWLGFHNRGTRLLITAAEKFKAHLPPEAFREWSREDPRWKDQWMQVENDSEEDREDLVDGLKSFMDHPWFKRVWILQEVANAKRAIVKCDQGEIPASIFALLPLAMGASIGEQCRAVLDIMLRMLKGTSWWNQNRNLCNLLWKFKGCKATDPRDKVYALLGMASDIKDVSMKPDYAKDELAVVRDFLCYLLGEEWPANASPASNIGELQSNLADLSREVLLQKLEQQTSVSSLKQFLRRQGSISSIDQSNILDIMQRGSESTSLFLTKTEMTVRFSSDTAFQTFRMYPDAILAALQKRNFVIEPMPKFILQAIEYSPGILGQLLRSSSNPDQLRDATLIEAIKKGLPSCRLFLDNCNIPVFATTEMVMTAIFSHRDVLQCVLELEKIPVKCVENIYLQATPHDPKGLRILDKHGKPIKVTKELILQGMSAGPDVLQIYLVVDPVELEEDLFLKGISKGPAILQCLLRSCKQPFNVTKTVYKEAINAGIETLEQISLSSQCRWRISESRALTAAQIDRSSISFLQNLDEKLQITERLFTLSCSDAKTALWEQRNAERDVPDAQVITAIESGPQAFTALLNDREFNFRVTPGICQKAIEEIWPFEILRVNRQSEVLPYSPIYLDTKGLSPMNAEKVRARAAELKLPLR